MFITINYRNYLNILKKYYGNDYIIQLFILSLWHNSNKEQTMGKFNSIQLMKMPWLKLFSMALVSVFTVSCLEKDIYQGPEDNGGGTDDTVNLFDYSTKKSLTINIDYQKDCEIPFGVFYSNPLGVNGAKDNSILPFITGKTKSNGKLTIQFDALPAGTKKIYLYSPTAFVTPLIEAQVEGEVVNFIDGNSIVSLKTTRANTVFSNDYYTGWNSRICTYSYPLGEFNADGLPSYIDNVSEKLDVKEYKLKETQKFKDVIENTLSDQNKSLGMYLTHQYLDISENANVFINFVEHNDKERNNSLAYYTISPSEAEPTKAPTDLAIAFPNLAAKDLKKGDVVQLKYFDKSANKWVDDFPKGSRIGFVLLVDAFKDSKLKDKVNLMYSCKRFNSYNIKSSAEGDGFIGADRPQMLAFMADGNLVLSFEDMPWHERRNPGDEAHGDFKDDIFTITANPVKALPDDVEPGIDPSVDEKPDMTVSTAGILAFEDNWPNAGDYDLNDVMFGYVRHYKIKFNGDNLKLLSIDEEYTFKNDGATFNNAFGYVIGAKVKRDDVEVTVKSKNEFTGRGLDPNLEYATVMLIDNTKGLAAGTTFNVETKFKQGTNYSYVELNFNPYNPFIVSMGYSKGDCLAENRIEVHLPKNFAPTPKADKSKFGTEDDKSLVNGSTYYYIRSGNYPFALEIVAPYNSTEVPNFKVPVEDKAIDFTYPKFNDWVKNPSANADWWK